MRLTTIALLGALTTLGCASSGAGPRGLDIALPGLDGTLVTPTPAAGDEIYVLAFWATWCQPCQQELTKLDALYAEKKGRGLEVYAINIDSPDTTAQVGPWVEREGYSFPVLIDRETQVLTRYNPRGDIPYYVVLDATGKILHDHQGYMSGDIDELSAFLDGVLRPG
ncbi:MAG: TlpA disulfide reductase family protein [Myxococcota bacterium]